MTEFNPFGATNEYAQYVPEQAEQHDERGGGSKTLVIALGALVGVAVAGGAFLFLSGGGEETDDFAPVARAPRVAAPAAAPTAAPVAKLPAQSNLTLGRNPFRALYVEPVAAAGPAAGTTTSTTATGGTTPIVLQPAAPPAQSTGGSTTPAAQPAPAPAPARQSTLRLLSVKTGKDGANPMALFDYDGKEVTGGEGDVMAGKLLVLSLQQDHTGSWFANLQLGDGSPFEVHERQTVVVQ